MKSTGANKETKQAAIVAALSLITAIAFKCGEEDVSVVLGIVGSVLGCGVAYVLPGSYVKTSIIPINTLAYPINTSLLSYPQWAQTTPQNAH